MILTDHTAQIERARFLFVDGTADLSTFEIETVQTVFDRVDRLGDEAQTTAREMAVFLEALAAMEATSIRAALQALVVAAKGYRDTCDEDGVVNLLSADDGLSSALNRACGVLGVELDRVAA